MPARTRDNKPPYHRVQRVWNLMATWVTLPKAKSAECPQSTTVQEWWLNVTNI
jgi:hypothetical protein